MPRKSAREKAQEVLAAGDDPTQAKKESKRLKELTAASSFEIVAREWFAGQATGWTASYVDKVIASLEIDVFPSLGRRSIAEIEAHHLVSVIRAVARGVRETAKRILQRTRRVFQYGIMTGRCARNPASDIDAGVILKKGPPVQHMARVKAIELPSLMRDIAAYDGEPVTRLALEMMALTFVRTAELIAATTLREMGYSREVVERQLAHGERNQVTAAYVHAEYLDERRRMMQHWSDFVDASRAGGKVVVGKFGQAA